MGRKRLIQELLPRNGAGGTWPSDLGCGFQLCCLPQASCPSSELGPAEKEDAVHPAQTPRACYLVLGPGMGWQLVALQLGLRLLLLMLSPQSPTHGLRSLATHTLQALTPLL